MPSAIVSRIYGAYYDLRPLPELEPEFAGRLRGKLRLASRTTGHKSAREPYGEGMRTRHLLIVGDRVEYTSQAKASGRGRSGEHGRKNTVAIEALEERRNAVYRSTASELHALGANLDRAIALISLSQPKPRWGFLDRFLAACHAGGVTAHIAFTKTDLVADEDREDIRRMLELYRDGLGYAVSELNLIEADSPALESLRAQLASGVSLLAGQSGTGKSTLMNRLLGGSVQKTGSISESTGKGRHTTTNSRLMLSQDRRMLLIDTPGVKEWGVQHLSPLEILESFPEISAVSGECRFRQCSHQPEQDGCAVQKLLEDSRQQHADYYAKIDSIEDDPTVAVPPATPGVIHPERLRSLLAMLDSLQYDLKIRTGDFIKATGRVRTGRIKPG